MARTMTSDARKKDTREKIELGGLIVKAGLRYQKRALLLGALIDLARRIDGDEGERCRLTAIGVEAFGPFLLGTALAGGLLALFLVALRAGPARAYLPVGPGWIERLRAPDGPAPYGVAIAAGALVAFPYTALGGALAGG